MVTVAVLMSNNKPIINLIIPTVSKREANINGQYNRSLRTVDQTSLPINADPLMTYDW